MLKNLKKISCCNIECFIPKYNGLGNFKMQCIDKFSDRFVFCLNNIWSEIWKCTKMAHYLELISWLFLICTLKILVFMVYFCYNMYSYSQELIFMSIEHYTYQNVQFHIHNTPHSLISYFGGEGTPTWKKKPKHGIIFQDWVSYTKVEWFEQFQNAIYWQYL